MWCHKNLGSIPPLSHNVTLRRPPPPLNVWHNLWMVPRIWTEQGVRDILNNELPWKHACWTRFFLFVSNFFAELRTNWVFIDISSMYIRMNFSHSSYKKLKSSLCWLLGNPHRDIFSQFLIICRECPTFQNITHRVIACL